MSSVCVNGKTSTVTRFGSLDASNYLYTCLLVYPDIQYHLKMLKKQHLKPSKTSALQVFLFVYHLNTLSEFIYDFNHVQN